MIILTFSKQYISENNKLLDDALSYFVKLFDINSHFDVLKWVSFT